MRPTRFVALLAAGALGLVACGSESSSEPDQPAAEAPADVAVTTVQTELGTALAGSDDHTVYGFTNDADGESTCNDACATTWPPVLVEENFTVGPGLDRSLFSTVERQDGTTQLVAGDWPLYSFSGDAEAGDTNGQGSGGVWFAVDGDASLIKTSTSAPEGSGDPAPDPAYGRRAAG